MVSMMVSLVHASLGVEGVENYDGLVACCVLVLCVWRKGVSCVRDAIAWCGCCVVVARLVCVECASVVAPLGVRCA